MPREHNEQGNFIETVTHGDVLGILDTVDGPVILSADVADELECSRDTARRKLSELHEQGKLDRRKVSRRIIYWEAEPEPEPEPETDSAASDRAHTAMLSGAETATETESGSFGRGDGTTLDADDGDTLPQSSTRQEVVPDE